MPATRGLDRAYRAQDAASQAIADLQAIPGPMDPPKALALAALIDAFDKVSERIRIMRGRPLPGTMRPTPKVKPVNGKPRPGKSPAVEPMPAELEPAPKSPATPPAPESSSLSEYPG